MEALVEVARFLAGDHANRTLANLNQASTLVHQETLPVLYEKVVWEKDKQYWVHDGGRLPEGYAYTRFLHVNENSYKNVKRYQDYLLDRATNANEKPEDQALHHLFPNLEIILLLGDPKFLPKVGFYSSCTAMLFASIKFDKFLEVILCGKNGRSTGIRDVYLHHYASLRHGHHYQIENVIFAGQGEIIRNAFAPRLNWWGNVAEREECEQTGREVVTWSKKGHHQIANFKTTPFADLKVRLLPPVNGLPLAIFDDLTLVPSSLAECDDDPYVVNSKVILPGAEGYDQHFVDQFSSLCPFRFYQLEIQWEGLQNKDAFRNRVTSIIEAIFQPYIKDEGATEVPARFLPSKRTLMTFTADEFQFWNMRHAVSTDKLVATVKVKPITCDAPTSRLVLKFVQESTVVSVKEYPLQTDDSD